MALYCGIDLHSTNSWIAVLNQDRKLIRQAKFRNDLEEILGFLESFRNDIVGIAVESTFNWYWLVDGLMDAGYKCHLANTWAATQYQGLKYVNDRHDARWLAHLLSLGILPEGFIYSKQDRPIRDLLRRRMFLVQKKAGFLQSMRGAFECRTGLRTCANDVKRWEPEDVDVLIDDPLEAFGITCMLEPVKVLNQQIAVIEKEVLKRARLRHEFKLLKSVWGVGKILALTIMYEVGAIRRFMNVGNFASYCRCVKSEHLSNGKRKGSGNHKNGNPHLSWAFSEAAHFADRYYETARKFVHRKRSNTNGIVAIRALANKLARASYHVLKKQVAFDPERLFS